MPGSNMLSFSDTGGCSDLLWNSSSAVELALDKGAVASSILAYSTEISLLKEARMSADVNDGKIKVFDLNKIAPNQDAFNHPEPGTDLEALKAPHTWPYRPLIPMVKRDRTKGGWPDVGLAYEHTPGVVYGANLFDFSNGIALGDDVEDRLQELPRLTNYASWEELLENGWECD